MARKTGSDELFKLIHSLTTEEKGYFKKFARRHMPKGNIYLTLFDAINKQKNFEEDSLKKVFVRANFKDLKLYLKDMITDAMIVYYKGNHPHIQLFNQLQKIHFLTIKGLSKESLKAIEKALKQVRQMELFGVESYLLRMQMDISTTLISRVESVEQANDSYRVLAKQAIRHEENLIESEIMNMDWFIAARKHDRNKGPRNLQTEREEVNIFPVQTMRAELEKLNTLKSIFSIESNAQARYEATKKAMLLSQKFRKFHDESFNVVPWVSGHIVSCNALKKYDEMSALCDQLLKDETNIGMYNDLAFSNVNFIRILLYYYTGDFAKGLSEIMEEKITPMLDLNKSKSNILALGFQKLKIALLFANQKFQESWLALQAMHAELKRDKSAVGELVMFEMMIQTEIGNYRSLPDMAKRAEKKLADLGLSEDYYGIMLSFFKQVTQQSMNENAGLALQKLKDSRAGQNIRMPEIFGLVKYHQWLEAKKDGKTLSEVARKYGKT